MEKEKTNKPSKFSPEGYILIPNYFFKSWIRLLGIGPALLYLELLSYCHKDKNIIWPTLTTLSNNLGISKNSLLSYQKVLLKYGLIKKIVKRRGPKRNYLSNIYKVTPIEGAKIVLNLVQNLQGVVQILEGGGAKIEPGVVQNLNPNNNHINNTNTTTTKDVAVVLNSKRLKEKGEEKMRALTEQLKDLNLAENFIARLFKDFEFENIEEKLDLLLQKKNIKNPAGWLLAALNDNYQDPEQTLPSPSASGSSSPKQESILPQHQEDKDKEIKPHPSNPVSPQEALKAIRLIREKLSSNQREKRGVLQHTPLLRGG
ncbi:MAG: hypothetical protein Kow00103_02320 [Candidatus Caldatribacteriota bacterium]